MTIQFAGVDLLLEDPEGAVRTWLDRHLNELHASIFCTENTAIREARFASITNPGTPVSSSSSAGWPAFDTPTVRRVGLPVGNYPKPPRPRINSLYWPTGATRWANALFLVRGNNLSAVLNACERGKSANLTIADGKGNGVATGMYLLAPRPVSADGVDPDNRLWLLPLVDARYFWQLYHVELYAPSTWGEALQKITGVSPSDSPQLGSAVPMAYGRPSAVEFVRDFENAALLVDAVALTLQRRVIGLFGPATSNKFIRYQTQTSEEATTTVAANLGHGWDEVAGGDFSSEAGVLGNVPSQIVVTYGNTTGDRISGYAKKDVTGVPVNGGTKVFHCSKVGSGNISESGEYLRGFEARLATEIEPDYYEWLLFQYDITYAGIVPWVPSGCDDYVRWEMTVKGKGKRRKLVCQTRAVSMPPNFGFESLPIDPLGDSSSSSSSQSSSSQSSSSQSSMSSNSSNNSSNSSTSSGSSTSTTSCKCGYTTFRSDGEAWEIIFSNCDPDYLVRPGTPGPAGTTIDLCCRCPSSSSSSQFSSGSSASSGSSTSTTSCKCGTTTYLSDGTSWERIASTCDTDYQVRPSVAPGPAGTTVEVCCRCPSSSSSSTSSTASSNSSDSSTTSSNSSTTSSEASSETSSGDSQTNSDSSTTSSHTSSATSSASRGSSTSSGSSGNSESSGTSETSSGSNQLQSSGTSNTQSSESASNTSSGSGSGNSGSGSGGSGSGGSDGGSSGGSDGGGGGSGGSDGSNGSSGNFSGTSSGSATSSGSETSNGSSGTTESSGSGGPDGSGSSTTPGCVAVVTSVSCDGDGHIVTTKTGILATTCSLPSGG